MSVIGEVYEILKDLKALSDVHKNKEISDKVLELQGKFYELKEENESLKLKIKELENASDIEQDLELLPSGLYVRKSEKANGKNIKYCAACFSNHHKLYPIVQGGMRSNHFCSNCRISVGG